MVNMHVAVKARAPHILTWMADGSEWLLLCHNQ